MNTTDEYITAREAARRFPTLTARAVSSWGLRKIIRKQDVIGKPSVYCAADIEKIITGGIADKLAHLIAKRWVPKTCAICGMETKKDLCDNCK